MTINAEIPGQVSLVPAVVSEFGPARVKTNPKETYVHSNDHGFQAVLPELSARFAQPEVAADSSALFIGTGHMFSLAPGLPQLNFIMADNDPVALRWQSYALQSLMQASSANDYRERVYTPANPILEAFSDQLLELDILLEDIATEASSLGTSHFLKTAERFRECQEALANKCVYFAQIDITSTRQTSQLASSMRAQGLPGFSFLNMTNLMDYGGGRSALGQALANISIDSSATIIYSEQNLYGHKRYRTPLPVVQRPCTGLSDYLWKSTRSGSNAYRY